MTASPVTAIAPPFLSPFNFARLHEATEISVVVIEIETTHHEASFSSEGGFASVEYR